MKQDLVVAPGNRVLLVASRALFLLELLQLQQRHVPRRESTTAEKLATSRCSRSQMLRCSRDAHEGGRRGGGGGGRGVLGLVRSYRKQITHPLLPGLQSSSLGISLRRHDSDSRPLVLDSAAYLGITFWPRQGCNSAHVATDEQTR